MDQEGWCRYIVTRTHARLLLVLCCGIRADYWGRLRDPGPCSSAQLKKRATTQQSKQTRDDEAGACVHRPLPLLLSPFSQVIMPGAPICTVRDARHTVPTARGIGTVFLAICHVIRTRYIFSWPDIFRNGYRSRPRGVFFFLPVSPAFRFFLFLFFFALIGQVRSLLPSSPVKVGSGRSGSSVGSVFAPHFLF